MNDEESHAGMSEHLANWIELEGCFNFRDLGGYQNEAGATMRTGLVFRADGLQRLSDSDLDHLRDVIGLGGVIDLRSNDEVREDGRGAIAEGEIAIHHVPLFPEARSQSGGQRREVPKDLLADMSALYFFMLEAASEPIAQIVHMLSAADTPMVFHCAAGKDRTGVISAVLLSLLGVPRKTIVADYAFSRQNIDLINARLNESESYQRIMDELPEGAYDADPAAMEAFLDKVDGKYGSVLGWAEESGVDERTRGLLQERLLE
jgi:protein tyrosine/serine phosphatase